MVLQTSFTTAAHLREIEAIDWLNRFRSDMAILAVVSLCLVHVLAAFVLTDWMPLVGELIYRNFVFVIGAIFPVILLFGGLNASSAKAIAFVTPCYALGFLIGGAFAPFLSIAMAGLALIYWRHRFVQTGRLSTAPFAGDKA